MRRIDWKWKKGEEQFLDIQQGLASEKNGLSDSRNLKENSGLANKKLLIIFLLIINNAPLRIFFSIEVVNWASFSGGKFNIVSKSAVIS